MNQSIYAIVQTSSQTVINTIIYDGVSPFNPGVGNTLVNITNVSPKPSVPGILNGVPFHWTYDGTNFNYVTGS